MGCGCVCVYCARSPRSVRGTSVTTQSRCGLLMGTLERRSRPPSHGPPSSAGPRPVRLVTGGLHSLPPPPRPPHPHLWATRLVSAGFQRPRVTEGIGAVSLFLRLTSLSINARSVWPDFRPFMAQFLSPLTHRRAPSLLPLLATVSTAAVGVGVRVSFPVRAFAFGGQTLLI